jgi:hypothetical protein
VERNSILIEINQSYMNRKCHWITLHIKLTHIHVISFDKYLFETPFLSNPYIDRNQFCPYNDKNKTRSSNLNTKKNNVVKTAQSKIMSSHSWFYKWIIMLLNYVNNVHFQIFWSRWNDRNNLYIRIFFLTSLESPGYIKGLFNQTIFPFYW